MITGTSKPSMNCASRDIDHLVRGNCGTFSSQKQEDKVNSACYELQTNHQQMSEHGMKSHTCRINRGVHGASWGKVVQNAAASGKCESPRVGTDFCFLLQDPKQRHQPGDQAWTTTFVMADVAAQNPICKCVALSVLHCTCQM